MSEKGRQRYSLELVRELRYVIAAMDFWGEHETTMGPKVIAAYANELELKADLLSRFELKLSPATIGKHKADARKRVQQEAAERKPERVQVFKELRANK